MRYLAILIAALMLPSCAHQVKPIKVHSPNITYFRGSERMPLDLEEHVFDFAQRMCEDMGRPVVEYMAIGYEPTKPVIAAVVYSCLGDVREDGMMVGGIRVTEEVLDSKREICYCTLKAVMRNVCPEVQIE
jgi:hypothetical protein